MCPGTQRSSRDNRYLHTFYVKQVPPTLLTPKNGPGTSSLRQGRLRKKPDKQRRIRGSIVTYASDL